MTGLRGVPGTLVPAEPGPEEYNAPVLRMLAWLASHPGAEVTWPTSGRLVFTATVPCAVMATSSYQGGLAALMDGVGKAMAEGRCPLHRQCPP